MRLCVQKFCFYQTVEGAGKYFRRENAELNQQKGKLKVTNVF